MASDDSTFEGMFRKRFGRSPTPAEMHALIDQSVTSHNQSGGITAHTVSLGPQPRKMDAVLQAQIIREIPKTVRITVVAVMGDGEAIQFALEIHSFLRANGYTLAENGISQGVFSGGQKGLTFTGTEFIVGTNIP